MDKGANGWSYLLKAAPTSLWMYLLVSSVAVGAPSVAIASEPDHNNLSSNLPASETDIFGNGSISNFQPRLDVNIEPGQEPVKNSLPIPKIESFLAKAKAALGESRASDRTPVIDTVNRENATSQELGEASGFSVAELSVAESATEVGDRLSPVAELSSRDLQVNNVPVQGLRLRSARTVERLGTGTLFPRKSPTAELSSTAELSPGASTENRAASKTAAETTASVEITPTRPSSLQSLIDTEVLSIQEIQGGVVPTSDPTLSQGFGDDSVPLERVNSVDRLSDVRPTDWAYSALRGLAERYNCLLAYPDGTYRGNRAMTRYEFAAGLDECMNVVQGLIEEAASEIGQADLLQLQRLQEEFALELAAIRARVDGLEERVAELGANQFSTTTKMYAFAWLNANAGFGGDGLKREAFVNEFAPSRASRFIDELDGNPNATANGLVWIDFVTSFTGRDSLVTQLAFGNSDALPLGNTYASDGFEFTYGTDFTTQGGGVNPNEVNLREMFYQFPVGDNLQVVVGPRFNFFRFIEGNQFAFQFGAPFLFNFFSFNSANSTLVNAIDRGAGALVMWNINPKLQLNLAYIGESNEYLPSSLFNSASDFTDGVFSPTNTATAELIFRPTQTSNIKLLYTRSNIQEIGGVIGFGIAEPLLGVADDGFGGRVGDATADTFAINADWLITPGFGIYGRYSYGSTNIFAKTPGRSDGEVNVQSYQIGLAFPNLGKQGSMGQLSFLVPYDILDGSEFLITGSGNGGTQYEFEASYFFPVSPNIAIVPSVFVIGNANNFDDNPTIVITNFRTQFNF
ncbi:MAG: carbohydrate porin [Oscillatoria sp. SIO1A7]|nr:carbohydrate porin [Oscillatoria sp. SIO1A7]